MMNRRSLLGLGTFVGVCLGVAALGSALTATSLRDWYQELEKPAWNPPDRVFGPVWTTLYLMIAVAGWLVWRRAPWAEVRGPLGVYGLQLGLNLAWSGLFFGLRSPGLGVAGIVALWAAIVATVVAFSRRSRIATVLMLPYLAWVTFASWLNYTIWRLNQ
jgi:tryptophan-rich sensory protein